MKDNNMYVKTYFRIEAGYVWNQGMDKEAGNKFKEEITKILSGIGFNAKPCRIGGCIEGFRGAENIYCHPMNLSGYVRKDAMEEIKIAISGAKTFRLRYIDTYEEALNYTPDELLKELQNRRPDIEKAILERFKTKRKNLFVPENAISHIKSGIPFFKTAIVGGGLERIEIDFICQVLEEMTKQGRLQKAQTKSGYGYRSVA